MHEILKKLNGGLIVSCQALEDEPLHSSYIMQRMAVAAMLGGAVGIRANSIEDICEIRKQVNLPIIGIIKKNYEDSEIYITPTLQEVADLAEAGTEIIAMDATNRIRPGGWQLQDFAEKIKELYPTQLFMADCATYEEAIMADKLGFDLISTTLCGYTSDTCEAAIPDFTLLKRMVKDCKKPIIAEGGIWMPEQLAEALDTGALAAVIGSAITRPMDITKRFVAAIKK